MKNIALASVVLAVTAVSPAAFAQCPAGSWLCADITIGTGGVAQPPPPPVVVSPPVYVAPPPPRVYYQPPPPPVVYYQPAPVYQPPPQYTYAYAMQPPPPPPQRAVYVGVQAQLGGAFLGSPNGGGFVGGAGLGLRLRGAGYLGLELAVNAVGGTDYNGDNRTEIPMSASLMVFFNPQHRFQVYGLVGLGASFANVRYAANNRAAHGGLDSAEYTYLGGQVGLGAEVQLSPRFSLFADARGFLRGRVDDDRNFNPEFARTLTSGATQTANGSMGIFSQFGAVLYF